MIHPEISFTHVLRELSVNRSIPCEVIRELISNSYDADASKIWYFPLLQYKGFIFIDNGRGMGLEVSEGKDITPYGSFFSIGRSIKQFGESVGYKCQGSKLCFASSKFSILTKTSSISHWYFKTIDNPKENLSLDFDISPSVSNNPHKSLLSVLHEPDERTRSILSYLKELLSQDFNSGTILVVLDYEAEDFDRFFNPKVKNSVDMSYIYNYIRFYTKHGDTCALLDSFDFPQASAKEISKRTPNPAQLFLWDEEGLTDVPFGFPYLEKSQSKNESPSLVPKLTGGRFQSRYAKRITHEGRSYALILAVDGRRRRLDSYSTLGRERNAASGIRLTDQCGVFISAQGIKSSPYNDLLSHSQLDEYKCLSDAQGQKHFTLIIDGTFPLVTNRNSLAEESIEVLSNPSFIDKVKNFLDNAKKQDKDKVFSELVDRLNKENKSSDRNKEVKRIDHKKKSLLNRERFRLKLQEDGDEQIFLSPDIGEEHGVGALYSTLSTLIFSQPDKIKQEFIDLWWRSLTFSGVGIDATALPYDIKSLSGAMMLEYKYSFNVKSDFNHPLCATDRIVAWKLDSVSEGNRISDTYDCFGSVEFIDGIDPELAFKIVDIEAKDGDTWGHSITVIGLRSLIRESFSVKFT